MLLFGEVEYDGKLRVGLLLFVNGLEEFYGGKELLLFIDGEDIYGGKELLLFIDGLADIKWWLFVGKDIFVGKVGLLLLDERGLDGELKVRLLLFGKREYDGVLKVGLKKNMIVLI